MVDLQGFEPWTSSMPINKYQSLADWTHQKTQDFADCDLDAASFTRAVSGGGDCCLPEQQQMDSLLSRMPMWGGVRHRGRERSGRK